MDYRKRRDEQAPINIDGTVVERVESHQRTDMVQTHQDSREEGTTKPIPPQECVLSPLLYSLFRTTTSPSM